MRRQGELPRQTVRALIWEIWISVLPGSQSGGEVGSLFSPEDWQDHQLTGFAGILSLFGVVSIGLTLMYVEVKHTYWFFKHMYLKKTSLLEKWTNTAAVHGGVSFYCPNRKLSHSIGKNHLNPLKTDNLSLLELMLLKCLSPQHKEQ